MRQASERREGQRRRRVREVKERDRVFTKHGQIGAGRKLKKQKDIPSLLELAAQQLPHTSQWAEGSDPHLRYLVTEPQQKGLKKIMGVDLIRDVSSRVEPVGDIEPLDEREIDTLMGTITRDLRGPYRSGEEINTVYSTLKNLREIPEDHVPNQFFQSYADRRREAKSNYMRKLRENLQEVKDDIQAVERDTVRSEGRPFDFERDFTFEDEHGNMLTGFAASSAERQFLDQMASENYKRQLAIAESYRNDLDNYAYSQMTAYNKYNDDEWLRDFGDDDELYHRYGP
jgi:hypothetical protein